MSLERCDANTPENGKNAFITNQHVIDALIEIRALAPPNNGGIKRYYDALTHAIQAIEDNENTASWMDEAHEAKMALADCKASSKPLLDEIVGLRERVASLEGNEKQLQIDDEENGELIEKLNGQIGEMVAEISRLKAELAIQKELTLESCEEIFKLQAEVDKLKQKLSIMNSREVSFKAEVERLKEEVTDWRGTECMCKYLTEARSALSRVRGISRTGLSRVVAEAVPYPANVELNKDVIAQAIHQHIQKAIDNEDNL